MSTIPSISPAYILRTNKMSYSPHCIAAGSEFPAAQPAGRLNHYFTFSARSRLQNKTLRHNYASAKKLIPLQNIYLYLYELVFFLL